MKFFKNKKGFTLVELVVVIAILGILGGIAIPRFMDATASARGAKIVADMRTIESSLTMYNAKQGTFNYPDAAGSLITVDNLVTAGYLASKPAPPAGTIKIEGTKDYDTAASAPGTDYSIATNSTSNVTEVLCGEANLATILTKKTAATETPK